MKKRNSLAVLLLAGVGVLGVSSCDLLSGNLGGNKPGEQQTQTHSHVFVTHEAVAATCLQTGMAAHKTCSECGKYFDMQGEEVTQASLVTEKLSHDAEHHDAVPATCVADGTGEYWTCKNEGDDNKYSDAQCTTVISSIPKEDAKGHLFGEVHVTWNGDEATATKECTRVGCDEVITETQKGRFVEDKAATCFSEQKGHYEVTFENTELGSARTEANSVTGEAATGNHTFDYANKVVTWNGDTATVTATCSTTGCTETDSEEKQGTFVKDSDATCIAPEKGHYEVEFNDSRFGSASTEANSAEGAPATGEHTYGTAQVSWSGNSATATATCTSNGCTASISETKVGTFVEDTAVTCHSAQKGHYEVEFNDSRLGSASTEANTAEGAPATGEHTYGTAEVSWSGSSATATATCTAEGCDAYITETKEGTFVKDTAETCTEPQKGHYEVTFNDSRLGSASSTANSVESGEPHAHTYGTLVPQVDPLRETAGMKAHYKCSECNGLFTEGKVATTAEALTIEAPAKHFTAGKDMNFDFDAPIAITETITVDVKLINPTSDSKVNFALFGEKEGGGSDWSNYFGYFAVRKNGVDSYAGITMETVTDDGYFRIKIDLSQVNRVGNENGKTPSFTAINGLYVRGGWTDVEGYIEINSTVEAHELGDFVEAKDPVRDVDGCLEHYNCKNCDAWLDEFGNVISKDEYTLKNPISTVGEKGTKAIEWHFEEPKGTRNPFGLSPIKAEGKVDLCDIQFSDVPAGGHSEFGVKLYDQWSTYYFLWFYSDGRVEVDGAASKKGVKDVQSVGVTYSTLDDGWTRVTIDFDFLNTQSQFLSDEGGKGSFDYINFIEDKNANGNPTYGKVEWFPTCYHKANNRGTLLAGGNQTSFKNCGVLGLEDTVSIDIKFVTATKVRIVFYTDDWKDIKKGQTDTTFDIKINADGSIVDQRKGANVYKVYNKDGSDTGYLRLFVNLEDFLAGNYYKKDGIFYEATSVNMFCSESYSDGSHYIDVKPNADVVVDPFLTFAGGSTNKGLNFKSANYVNIKDGDGNFLTDKALSLDVRAEGSGKVYMTLMDDNWKNLGKLVMTFEDGELTDCVMQGNGCNGKKVDGTDKGNVWPKRNANADRSWNLNIPIGKLNGDGWASTDGVVGFFYDGDGILADGVTSFGVNTLDFCLADIAK